MGQLTGTINAISICQIMAYIIYSVCLIGIFELCYVVMETTKCRSATKQTRNHNFNWIAPEVMSGEWSVVGYQSSKWKFEFTGLNQILEFIIYTVYLKKILKNLLDRTNFTSLGPEDQCSLWGLGYWQCVKSTLVAILDTNLWVCKKYCKDTYSH